MTRREQPFAPRSLYTRVVNDSQRATFAGLADALLPAVDDLPAASDVAVHGRLLDRVLAARPDLTAPLAALCDVADGRDPATETQRLHADEPAAFAVLAEAAEGAYLMHRRVRRLIGYPGQGGRPILDGEAEDDLRGGILDEMIARGRVFVTPSAATTSAAAAPTPLPRSTDPAAADVVIIGAGAGGGVAAWRLAQAGLDVVLLEQGDWYTADRFPGASPEWELVANTSWSPDPNVRQHPSDYPIEVSGTPITPLMMNGVGGSTLHFGAQWVRLRPGDFKVRSLEGVGDDWPLSYDELQPFYERIDQAMQISGLSGDPAYPAGVAPPLPPLPIGRVGRTAAIGMNRLGWHWWPAAHAIRSRPVGTLAACERTGTCMWGCPKGAKSSADTTVIPAALRLGALLVTGARVREITVDGERATGAVYVDRAGRERFQAASVVVVAANGVGTPRLLLNSVSRSFPDGLANRSGLVGRRLMLHPYMSVLGIYEDPLESWIGPWGTQLLSLEFADGDEQRGFARGAQWDVMPPGGPAMHLARFNDRPFETRWGSGWHDLVRRTFGHAFDWGVGIEDLPDVENRVTLDARLTDSDGIPAPRITFAISADARANLAWQLERAREAHEAAGAIETQVTDWSQWGWHLLGTARMGDEPATSVVDRWSRAHDVDNLYLMDGSVFPTSGPMAPTATICALALRACERLLERGLTR